MVVVLALFAMGHHQLAQLSNTALNTSFVTVAQAYQSPSPSPTATPTPTPGPINQSCTLGFYKKHPELLTGCGITKDTKVSDVLGATNVEACVGNLTLIQALNADGSACGSGNLAQAELILVKQLIAALGNAVNSTPTPACVAGGTLIGQAIIVLSSKDRTQITSFASQIESSINNDQFGTLCGGS
jgi:hypothetical protein